MINLSNISTYIIISSEELSVDEQQKIKREWTHYFPELTFQFTQHPPSHNPPTQFNIYLQNSPKKPYNRKKTLIISHTIPILDKLRTSYIRTHSTSISEAINTLLQWLHCNPIELKKEKTPTLLSTHIEFWEKERPPLDIFPLTLTTFKKNLHKTPLFIDILHAHPIKKLAYISLSLIINTWTSSTKVLCCNSTYELEFKLAQNN